MKTKRQTRPLPFWAYFSTIAALVSVGFIDSMYLAWSHYRNYTDMTYQSFCAISKAINCDTVSQSPYSIFLGVPLAVWGLIGYGLLMLMLVLAWRTRDQKKCMWTLVFFISMVFSLISIALAIVSAIYIHSYCILCVLSFGVNFLLLYFSWIIRKRFGAVSFFGDLKSDLNELWIHKKTSGWLLIPFCCLVTLGAVFFPRYWEFKTPHSYQSISVGITEDGHPWIGAKEPVLEITEFTDYLCFQCKKTHYYLRQIIMDNPDKIRLIHRHYPLDDKYNFAVKESVHKGSGDFALLAIYAATKGKFWEMNDLLFGLEIKDGSVSVKELADKVGLDGKDMSLGFRSQPTLDALRKDLWDGYQLGITGTPTFLIEGELYVGEIPSEIINKAIE